MRKLFKDLEVALHFTQPGKLDWNVETDGISAQYLTPKKKRNRHIVKYINDVTEAVLAYCNISP